jgi:hypothetical protein
MFGLTNFDRTFTKSDFHAPVVGQGEERQIESSLSIEVIFSFADGEDGIPDLFEDMTVKEEGADPILRVRLLADWTDDGISPDGNIDTRMVQVSVPPGEAEDGTSTTPFAAKKRALIQAFYVPAIRKPSEQMKFSAGAILHRLYRRMERPTNFDDEFEALIDQVDAKANDIPKFRLIQETLAEEWKRYNRDAKYNNARIAFASQDFESFLRKLEVEFSPTDINRPYGIRELGEGYRSLFYLTLVSTLLKIEAEEEPAETDITVQPYLTILLTEEPENHVSPQLLGVVLTNLKDLSTLDNAQVVISSHTPAILKRIDPENIRHLRIDATEHRSIVKEIALPEKDPEAFKYIKEAVRNYPELYFAKLAILGEGDSEEVVFSALARAYGTDFDSHYITVAPLGGRFVNHVWRLLENLGIPYVTLLDLDQERGTGGYARIKYALKQILKYRPDKKQHLLTLDDEETLSDKELAGMHKWKVESSNELEGWLEVIEEEDLFFSSPLDLDFLMYEAFPETYQATAPDTGGPEIPSKEDEPEEYMQKLETSIQATLKSKKATGATYTEEEKAAMIWYNYLFLGRAKPTTHITAMANLSPQELKDGAPDVLLRMFDRIDAIINQE